MLPSAIGIVSAETPVEPVAPVVTVAPVVPAPIVDDTTKADITAIKTEVLKDSDWEAAANAIALAEMNEREYKNVFNALVSLNISIVDREDITKVIVTETDVSDTDVDDKDAIVEYELKVYYEDADGDDKKVYLILTSEIVDSEVESTEYELA
jgi:hypothetical protein